MGRKIGGVMIAYAIMIFYLFVIVVFSDCLDNQIAKFEIDSENDFVIANLIAGALITNVIVTPIILLWIRYHRLWNKGSKYILLGYILALIYPGYIYAVEENRSLLFRYRETILNENIVIIFITFLYVSLALYLILPVYWGWIMFRKKNVGYT